MTISIVPAERGWWRWEIWDGLRGGKQTLIVYGHRYLYADAASEAQRRFEKEKRNGD